MLHSAMIEYRFFVLNPAGEIQSSSFALCEDDAEAARHAAKVAKGAAVEVWDVGRLVFRASCGASQQTTFPPAAGREAPAPLIQMVVDAH